MNIRELRKNFSLIALLATFGVLLIIVIVAVIIALLNPVMGLVLVAVFGALISAIDLVAVIALFSDLDIEPNKVSKDLENQFTEEL